MQIPAAVYEPSPRSYPARAPDPEHPTTMLVRSVHHQGQIRWKKHEVILSKVLWGERVGLLPVNERWFTVYFDQFPIARFDSRKLRVLSLPQEEDDYIADAGEGDDSPSLHPFPSRQWRENCQECARSKMSGMSPAIQPDSKLGPKRDRTQPPNQSREGPSGEPSPPGASATHT